MLAGFGVLTHQHLGGCDAPVAGPHVIKQYLRTWDVNMLRSAVYGGGGLKALQSAVVVTNCLIANNTSPAGAGLATDREYSPGVVNNATTFVTDSTFTGNVATQTGGAIATASMDLFLISNVTFAGNIGMHCQPACRAFACDRPFPVNDASPSQTYRLVVLGTADQGGALWFGGTQGPNEFTTITGCTFTDNSADYGGAIYAMDGAYGTMSASTFTANMAKSGGAAILADAGSFLQISSCTFASNGNNTAADPPLVSRALSHKHCNMIKLIVSRLMFFLNPTLHPAACLGAVWRGHQLGKRHL